jgi:hypothetical protein
MKTYLVNVYLEYKEQVKVVANSAEEAEKLAMEEVLSHDDRSVQDFIDLTDTEIWSVDGVLTEQEDEE